MSRGPARDEALSQFVQVRARYRRAMNLERDTGHAGTLAGYLVTPIVRRALGRIVSGIVANGTERAWSLTGPYGSGKTAFAVFLSDLLGQAAAPRRAAHRLLGLADGPLSRSLHRTSFVPVILTGERAPLDLLLVRALRAALDAEWSTRRGPKPAVIAEIARLADRFAEAPNSAVTSSVVACFERARVLVAETLGAGLLLVVDEAGKILEYAAQNPTRGDVQLFQALAEIAPRSGDKPFVMVAVLHQAFDEYAARLSATQRKEWAKVQGRFADLIFQEEPEHLVRLVAEALEPARERPSLPDWWPQHVDRVSEWASQATGWDRKALAANLDRCWPLHPVTALLLGPLFRGSLAQNERSLFAFLSSGEPLGFHEFLRSAPTRSLYTPDRLYDYVMAALGTAIFGRDGRLWAEIDIALRRLSPEADAADAKVVKTAGLLAMLGEQVGLRAAGVVIESALVGEPDVSRAIARLQASSVLIYRKFRDAYQIWEGSDLDLDNLVREAMAQQPPGQPLAPLLARLVPPRPIIARRHLFHTGTMRYFDARFIDGDALVGDMGRTIAEAAATTGDGLILMIAPGTDDVRAEIRRRLAEGLFSGSGSGPALPLVIVIPSSTAYVGDLAWELSAIERVEQSTPALQSDPVARKELSSRLGELTQLLEQEVARVFAPENPDAEWWGPAGRLPVGSSRDLMGALSDLFDLGYREAPPMLNELLNRRELSSSAAKARRNLLEAMILHRSEARLGLLGYPPEVSMYRSVFEESGLHREVDGKWCFVAPEGAMRGVWSAIEAFLDGTERGRKPLHALYERLKRPPFGIKDGPLPVLVCAALIARESEVAVYEQGSLVPELSAPVIERLLRWPERFELRQSRIAGVRLEVLERLARSLFSGGKPTTSVLDLVRGLMRFVNALPSYARNTAKISDDASRVREALLRARDPAQLLFTELPEACGCRRFEVEGHLDETAIDGFFATLKRSLGELQGAYRHLLFQVEQLLADSLGLPGGGPAAREELRARAQRVYPIAVEPLLRGFLIRATDEALDHEDWIVSLATYLAAKPPTEWADRDHDQFGVQLAVVARRFRSLEAMALAETSPNDGTRLVRVAVARQGGIEQESVVAVREEDMQTLALLRKRIMTALDEVSKAVPRDTVVAALALVTEGLIAAGEIPEAVAAPEPA